MHREAVMGGIKILESENLIAVKRKLGAGSSYRLIGFNYENQSAITDQSEDADQSIDTDWNQSADADQLPPKNQSAITNQSVIIDPDQSANTDSNQSVNTDTNQGIEPVNKTYKRKRKKTTSAPSAFSTFYDAYPRKQDRAKAETAWKKLNPDETLLDEIMAGLNRAKKSQNWLKNGGQYIPHPSTWLNGKRWEDDFESVTNAQPAIESFLGLGGLI